jgi:ferredoxin-NADP reductase
LDHDQNYYALRVAAVVEETADTRSFVLEVPTELGAAFAYEAGQFCTFRATLAADEDRREVVRCYSMSSSPHADGPLTTALTTTVKRVPDGVMSNWMIDTLQPGDSIEAMRPSGLFVLQLRTGPTPAPIVAFGGGSGITPIMSIVECALATTERPITLVYANRDADSVIFAARLRALAAESGGRLTVHFHLDSESGFLTPDDCARLVGDAAPDATTADFYVCGPGPYMDVVESAIATLGISPAQLFIERFVVPGEHVLEERSGTESITIRLNGRKTVVDYRMGDTILDTARRGGLKPPFSCESGSCATCMAHLDEGHATMRVNNALRPDEVDDGWVLTCQAVPQSRHLTVDYDA